MEFDAELKFAKIQNSDLWGGGVSQDLMLSSNLLKSKIPICGGGGGGSRNLMLSSNLLKSKIPICVGSGGGWNLMLSSNLLKSKICICWGGSSRNLMLSSNLLKSKIPICWEGGVAEFDAEFKFAKIQNSHLWGGGGGRVGGWWNQFPTFDAESKFAIKKKIFCEKFSKLSGKNWNGFVRSIANHNHKLGLMTLSIRGNGAQKLTHLSFSCVRDRDSTTQPQSILNPIHASVISQIL